MTSNCKAGDVGRIPVPAVVRFSLSVRPRGNHSCAPIVCDEGRTPIHHSDKPNDVFRSERIIQRPLRSIYQSCGQAEHLGRRSRSRRPAMKTVSATNTNSFAATMTVAAILGLAAGASTARAWDQQATDAGMSTEPSHRAAQGFAPRHTSSGAYAIAHSHQRAGGAGGDQRHLQLDGRLASDPRRQTGRPHGRPVFRRIARQAIAVVIHPSLTDCARRDRTCRCWRRSRGSSAYPD